MFTAKRLVSTIGGLFLVVLACSKPPAVGEKAAKYNQHAPLDAYLNGSEFAYYGAESKWHLHMFSERAADRSYKRRGQRQLLAILNGRPRRAIRMCEKRLAENPQDQETLFLLTIAYTQLGKLDSAFEALQSALEAGLPFERFLAGPRALLEPLTRTDRFRELAAKHPVRLIHGPMLGCMTDNRVRFWVRTLGEDTVRVEVTPAGRSGPMLVSKPARTAKDKDYTAVLEVRGLEPGLAYSYGVVVNGRSELTDPKPQFRTFPPHGKPARFRVVFGGGAGYAPDHERMWDVIHAHRPAALLLLGDNVYVDLPQMPGPFHQYTYYRRQSRPEFRRLVSETPVYTIWDDHDAATDDAWLGPYRDKPAWKMPMLRFFQRQWNNPASGTVEWPGVWYRFMIGDVEFFMLDCRTYRTNPFAPGRTMLGPVQKKWLLEQLGQSQASFKVLVSSVPWAPGTKPGSHDTWDGFPEEREEIFSFIAKKRINGVILLSADRHRSDVWRIERPGAYPLYEFESSKLTNMHTHRKMPGALFSYNEKCSFGQLDFDTTARVPVVTCQIFSIDDEPVYQLTVGLDQLSFSQ